MSSVSSENVFLRSLLEASSSTLSLAGESMFPIVFISHSPMLYSGFQTMSISEVFGEFRCGKTQLSHTMSVITQLPKDMGGAEGKVAYIGALDVIIRGLF